MTALPMKTSPMENAMETSTVAGHPVVALSRVESTNAEAINIAGELSAPVWVIARHQVAGRGRLGRQWVSRDGDLTATWIFQPGVPERRIAELSFVAGLAVFDMAAALIGENGNGDGDLALKWPNDLLFQGKKLAGLLLESAGNGWVAAGIGVNLVTPTGIDGATSIADITGQIPGNMAALEILAPAMDSRIARWRGGFAAVRQAWLEKSTGVGEPVRVRVGGRTLEGVFEGLDDSGAMQLMTADGLHLVSAGDVFPVAGAAS